MPEAPQRGGALEASDLAAILAVVVVWGVNFVAMKVGLSSLTPFQMGAGRYLFAFLLVLFVAYLSAWTGMSHHKGGG